MELQDILALVKAGFTRAELLELAATNADKPQEPAPDPEELTLHGLDAKIQVMADAIKALASQQEEVQRLTNMRRDDMGVAEHTDQRSKATSALAQLMGRQTKEG